MQYELSRKAVFIGVSYDVRNGDGIRSEEQP